MSVKSSLLTNYDLWAGQPLPLYLSIIYSFLIFGINNNVFA